MSLTKRPLDPYIRPAFGVFTEQSLAIHQKMSYYTVFWSLSHMDWSPQNEPSPQKSLKILCEQLSNGAIIQLTPRNIYLEGHRNIYLEGHFTPF